MGHWGSLGLGVGGHCVTVGLWEGLGLWEGVGRVGTRRLAVDVVTRGCGRKDRGWAIVFAHLHVCVISPSKYLFFISMTYSREQWLLFTVVFQGVSGWFGCDCSG